jgi:hypothetical protein
MGGEDFDVTETLYLEWKTPWPRPAFQDLSAAFFARAGIIATCTQMTS